MLPSILARQLRTGIEDYIETTFPMTNGVFCGSIQKLLNTKDAIYHEPYFTVRMPFRNYEGENNFFEAIHSPYTPYVHQAKAFQRLSGNDGASTLIATGTGSGKTECFLYPILEYCYQHRNKLGIKALIIYPMNALASDQAKRIAKLIWNSPELHNNVNVGMYVGGHTSNSSVIMTEDGVITDKETLLKNPPDILLTNYKMLDYLLVRPKDAQLWKNNTSETLKYVAVDELHTFDGAQGTDLACLLRRLKNRLGIQGGHLCCIGTSATMGSKENAQNILKYASEIFGEPFDEETSIVTEDRLTYSEFLSDYTVSEYAIPSREDIQKMEKAISEDNPDNYIEIITKSWFPDFNSDITSDEGKFALADALPKHIFFQSLIAAINGTFCQSSYIIESLKNDYTELNEITSDEADILIESILALISLARTGVPGKMRPFLDVHVQLWLKELRRLLAKVSSEEITYAIESDLNEAQVKQHLPVINCRDCGATGWGTYPNERKSASLGDLRRFYNKFFSFDDGLWGMFPYDSDEETIGYANKRKLCTNCLQIMANDDAAECDQCGSDDLIRVQVPPIDARKNTRQYVCPFCKSKRGLNLIGLRSATEISASISQMFSSKFNDDKKTLTFSDNVQDAAHKAGFFNSRTWKFGLRGAIQQYVQNGGEGKNLNDFSQGFIEYWQKNMDDEEFTTFFTPPNLTWMRSYENMIKNRKITYDKDYENLIYKTKMRLAYEIMLEYGLTSHIGRTLEKSGSSVLGFDNSALNKCVESVYERLINELGYSELTKTEASRMVLGVLDIMRRNGAFDDKVYRDFVRENFNEFFLRADYAHSLRTWMPAPRSKLRLVVRNNQNAKILKYKTYDEITEPKYNDFVSACTENVLNSPDAPSVILDELIKNEIVTRLPADNVEVYAINKEKTYITSDAGFVKCSRCGTKHTVAGSYTSIWEGMPCIRGNCCGRMQADTERSIDYYGRLYANGDLLRVNAKEHTGLLQRTDRENIEKDFKRPKEEQKLYDPNVLSCTPTLEMGIDIGDLSSVILCSVPPSQANYAQRVGRAGRKDGNALTLAVANAKKHDLYFYEDPLDMISGEVVPPQIFLKASAVLERQFVAYCMDSWVKSGIDISAVPLNMGICINKYDNRSSSDFPYNFMNYINDNLNSRLNSFMLMFSDSFANDPVVKQELTDFARGNGSGNSQLCLKIMNAFDFIRDERNSVQDNIRLLQNMIKELESKPKDSSYDEEIKELKWEEAALISVVKSINSRDIFNFLSDEGLIPNYAFPESGVTLKAILKRKNEDQSDSSKNKYDKMTCEYERSASAAISEFAPNNSFYVDGKKLVIDQVDVNVRKPIKWRLCPNCSHAEELVAGRNTASCPKCHTTAWADKGQIRSMLKVQLVYSNMDYRKSQIDDESEDRTNLYFCKQLLVDVNEESDITAAFEMKNKEFAFGYEFVKKATLREINFGEKDSITGDKLMVSGIEEVRKGFKICKFCGKIQPSNPAHTFTCKARKEDFKEEPFEDCLFLYREFTTEILRLLIPATTMNSSTEIKESFVAAFMLGMREYFGNVSHLRATVTEIPEIDADYRKQYLVIYDSIPGGTGYLKQLLQNEDALVKIFEKALVVMENCSCKNDESKNGCYHCLYAYSMSNSIGNISRKTAIKLFKTILSGKGNIKKMDKLGDIHTNSIFDSELEKKFIEAFPKKNDDTHTISITPSLTNQKEGYILKINDFVWEIEPQVDLDRSDGVSVKCRPDFVIRPLFDTTKKPVAVFTDGFSYHKDRIADDTLKRESIRRSGNYVVWSLSYKDVQDVFQKQGEYFSETLDYTKMPGNKFYKQVIGLHSKSALKIIEKTPLVKTSNFEILLQYLSIEDAEKIFASYADAYRWSLIDLALNGKDAEKSILDNKISELNKALYKQDKPYQQGGIWSARDVSSHLTVYNRCDSKDGVVYAVLDDNPDNRTDKYEAEWNGMLRFSNIMQFYPGYICVSTNGIRDYAYSQLQTITDLTANNIDTTDTSAEWNEVFELLEYSDDTAKEIASFAMENNLPVPEIGYEVGDNSGKTIGELEIAWPEKKIGYLSEENQDDSSALIDAGWKFISSTEELTEQLNGGEN